MTDQVLQGELAGVYLRPDSGSLRMLQTRTAVLRWEGLEGDAYAGLTRRADVRAPEYPRGTEIRNTRQVSIVSVEELEEIARRMGLPRIEPVWLLANLALRGIPDLTHLPPATRLIFPGGAGLVVESENRPCRTPGEVIQEHYPERKGLAGQFPRVALGLRGVVAWVERPGQITVGDSVAARTPRQTRHGAGLQP